MKKTNITQIIKWTGNIVTLLSIIFVIKVTLSLNMDLSFIRQPVEFIIIAIICSLVMAITVFFLAFGWKTILSVFAGQKVSYKDASGIYARSNMGKYLPGNVMHYVERNLFANSLGLEQKSVFLATLTEIAGLICVCTVFGLLTMGKQIAAILILVVERKYLAGAIILLIFITTLILVFNRKIKTILNNIPWKLLAPAFLKTLPIYFFSIILGGCTLAILFASLNSSSITLPVIFRTLAVYTISWVIGFVIPGSPGGIGVREFVLLFLLKNYYTEDLILTCILVHRFTSILGDIIAYLVSVLWKKIPFKQNETAV